MSLTDRFPGLRRRRVERDVEAVRVRREIRNLSNPNPQPTRHRAPARNAGPAMREIIAQAPVELPPMVAALALHSDTARWLDSAIERLEGGAADDETEANYRLGRASWARGIVAELRAMKALAESPAPVSLIDGPQVPLDDDHQGPGRGPRCYGCDQPGDTRQCWNQAEGRNVPLCPRCHPSADVVDDSGADGEEPERVDEDMANASAVWHAEHPGELCPDLACAQCAPEQMPEALTAVPPRPVTGPAAVPQLDPDAAPKQTFRYFADGMATRETPAPTNGAADTLTFARPERAR